MDKKVFQPITIKSMTLKNRIALAPLLMVGDEDGSYVGDRIIRWLEHRAKGGAALIMMGAVGPSATVKGIIAGRTEINLYDDKYIPGFARLAEVIHSYGARLGVQLASPGPMGGLGASPPPYPDESHRTLGIAQAIAGAAAAPVHELTVGEIEHMEDDFATAALRAKTAGLDCVLLHCAHGGATIHCSFISPYYNRRTDRYGGSWENRLRFPVETIKKMREAVGDDYPILVRIDADELLGERGITVDAATGIVVPALEKAGVDCIDVSQGCIVRAPYGITIPLFYPRGCFIHHATAVKRATKLPVIGVGRIVDMDMAEKFLQEGKADIIYMGRQITADPETPNKYYEGRLADIRTCIGCLDGCSNCAVNYDIQSDTEPIPLVPAEEQKNVLVVGGGVGGMEAARILALRGHRVTLLEKDSHLGGMVAALALVPLTAEFGNIVEYLAAQMKKLRVDVRLCKEATSADIEALKPDAVILASGSSMLIPEIARGKPGVMDYIQAARNKPAIGQRVVIWGLVGASLAISLAEEGKDVVIIGRGGEETLARDDPGARRSWILRKLTDINVARETPEAIRVSNPEVIYYVDVQDITPRDIEIVTRDGARRALPYDTFIIARERISSDSLYSELQGKLAEVHKIGDCAEVGTIKKAIHGANDIARRI